MASNRERSTASGAAEGADLWPESGVANVRVCVRCRPLIAKELVERHGQCVRMIDEREVVIGDSRKFTFDVAYGPTGDQATLFQRCVAPLVDSCFQGYNATVFAYGQTGSGKTYTMGTAHITDVSDPTTGVIPRAVRRLFEGVSQRTSENEFLIRASYLEIYCERMRDLLDQEGDSKALAVREDGQGNVSVAGAEERVSA